MKNNPPPPTPLVCFGDSITACAKFPEQVRWPNQLQAVLNASHPGRYEVFNRGVGGNTTYDGLLRFGADVMPYLPGVVLIEFGFNDASVPGPSQINRCVPTAFKAQLVEMVRLVRAGKGLPVLVVNHPIAKTRPTDPQANGKDYFENYAPYPGIIREVANETEVAFIDLEHSMGEAGVSPNDLLDMPDGLHLQRGGNAIYARHILRGLLPILEKQNL